MSVYETPLYETISGATTLVMAAAIVGPPPDLAHHFSDERKATILAAQCAFVEHLASALHNQFPDKPKRQIMLELGMPADLLAAHDVRLGLAKIKAES